LWLQEAVVGDVERNDARGDSEDRNLAPGCGRFAHDRPDARRRARARTRRDEGEAFATRLRAAGVPVTATRYGGIIHDFVMLHPLAGTHAAKAATTQGAAFLREALNAS
jgi:acetyl esterase/lipase